MSCGRRALFWLLVVLCTACSTEGEYVRPETVQAGDLVDPNAPVEDLYFEVLRLHSMGWFSQERLQVLQDSMDQVESELGDTAEERTRQLRKLLLSMLRRTWSELRRGEDALSVSAEESRAYTRRLYRAGRYAAEQGAEGVVLVADMLGVPTSKGGAVPMVAAPFGGHLVVRVANFGLKRTAFLLRRFRTADDFLERGAPEGFELLYAANKEQLQGLVGKDAVKAADQAREHVGAVKRPGGKTNYWNPDDGRYNCSACVAAFIKSSAVREFTTAADIERRFGSAGIEKNFALEDSLRYIQEATGLRASSKAVAILAPRAPRGHYAIFTRIVHGGPRHVVYGHRMSSGRVVVFDPQSMERMSYQELLKRYGPARPYHLEEP